MFFKWATLDTFFFIFVLYTGYRKPNYVLYKKIDDWIRIATALSIELQSMACIYTSFCGTSPASF